MPSPPDAARARELVEETLAKLASSSRSFYGRARSQAGVDLRLLLDPRGEAVASLVDGERAPGASLLAVPMDLILFETWVLGHFGDHDELDLDVNTHRDVWFSLGAWIGETLRDRHGGFWLMGGEDPRAWRMGLSKIMLEIAPHVFAEKLLRSGQGFARRMVSEMERIRATHEEQAQASGGKLKDRYTPQHYARMHAVPFGQWLVLDMSRLENAWGKKPAGELSAEVSAAIKKLPPENAALLSRIDEALGKLEKGKPAAEQVQDRGLYEAVAQLLAMKRATQPVPMDLMEKIAMPALHVGLPDKFPPLGDDDIENIKKGADLFAVYVDTIPYAHPAEEGGFLGTFSPQDLGTPYPDRQNLDLGKGDWLAVNPARLVPMMQRFDPRKMLEAFDKFVDHVQRQDGVPRIREHSRGLAETAARAIFELMHCVSNVDKGSALVFRLLPPPA
ncbi:MAG: hypothetical protein HY698_12475 [Deltaproteobacteria bacterium]|nr:hypothetical protein [Deltaproteobacteria bacterium]